MATVSSLKRIAVFGVGGFVGGNVGSWLVAHAEAEIMGFTRKECDLLDGDKVRSTVSGMGTDTAVIMCSAVTRRRSDNPDAMFQNMLMTRHLVEAIERQPVRSVLFVSSSDVYGVPPRELPITEEVMPDPSCCYGISKLTSELLLKVRVKPPCDVTILRCPGIYGSGDSARSIIGSFAERISGGQPVVLDDGGTCRRDYVWSDDLCRVIGRFVEDPVNDVVNVATGRSVSVRQAAEWIGIALNRAPKFEERTSEGPRGDLEFDISKLKRLCPGITMTSIEDGIRMYCRAMARRRPVHEATAS